MTESAAVRTALSAYYRARRENKPQKMAAAITSAVTTLPSQAEVIEFVTQVRVVSGVQDLSLLPEMTFKVRDFSLSILEPVETLSTEALIAKITELGASYTIDFPNVMSHWGFAVNFSAGETNYRAISGDYQNTETYLSM